jgi:2-keto-3-deoxy-L-rhamnonate aldolase RhmA
MSRYDERIAAGEPAIGTMILHSGPEWVDLVAHSGFDFVCIDHMITAIGWAETANMIRAAKQFGCSPWVRLQGYPWAGSGRPETLVAANVLRAIAIGAEGVTASVDTPEEAAAMLHAHDEQHRRIWIMGGEDAAPESAHPTPNLVSPDPKIFPLIESLGAANRIEEFCDLEHLEMVFYGLGDLSRLLGASSMQDPAVLKVVERGVRVAERAGKYISVTTGYVANPTVEEVNRTIKLFWDIGAKALWIPYPTYLMQAFYRRMFAELEPLRPRART